jgi:hypothetical protein
MPRLLSMTLTKRTRTPEIALMYKLEYRMVDGRFAGRNLPSARPSTTGLHQDNSLPPPGIEYIFSLNSFRKKNYTGTTPDTQ